MGFPTLRPLCGPICVTYAPVGDTPNLDILLLGIKDSKDRYSVGRFVFSFANRPNGHRPLHIVEGLDGSKSKTSTNSVCDYFCAHNQVTTAFFVGLFARSPWKGYFEKLYALP